jgi:peptidoglycan/LPS O-acetylase OafA/YrhL
MPLWPAMFDFLAHDGRIAVQVFLVLGGFLAARGLAPQGRLRADARPLALAAQRYQRLVLPYAAVLVLAVAASALASRWMVHSSISAPPGPAQLLAHLLLLQDLLGYESLSAGLWYVAIDLQLFVLLLALLDAGRRLQRAGPPLAPWLVLALAATSLLWLNRVPAWDVAAPYFFGSYGLGVLLAWRLAGCARVPWTLALMAAAVALWLEWRWRIAVSLGVALLLYVRATVPGMGRAAAQVAMADQQRAAAPWSWLSRISFGVFLVHFPVLLIVNAAFTRFGASEPAVQAAGMLVAWAASVAAGAAFHRWVERPLLAWRWAGAPTLSALKVR